jgi:adenylate cyclase
MLSPMSAQPSAIARPLGRWIPQTRRDLRLASGIVLFTYVTLHLSCHALGLVSLDAAESALRVTVMLWHSPPGTLLLYGAAATHICLALLAVYDRRTLRMPPLQALRIVLGMTMPVALIGHFIATRYAFERFALPAEYSRVVSGIWANGASGLSLGLLAPGWIHGCLGLRYAFGHRPDWQRWKLVLFAAALLLPVLAGVGFVTMARELEARRAASLPTAAAPTRTQEAGLREAREGALAIYVALVAFVAVGRSWRSVAERRDRSVVWIDYPGRKVSVPRGWTVLEASRSFGIPHAAMCGGRGRCTTCRVRVVHGASHCPPPNADEQRALDRIAPTSTEVRLACQLRPTADIAVEPLVSVAGAGSGAAPQSSPSARDHDAALLLVDVRVDAGSRSIAAHDTIHALGRSFAVVHAAAASEDVEPDKHSASSWLLLFRADDDRAAAVARAIRVAERIANDAERLAEALRNELGLAVQTALVLHVGRIAVGTIGAGATAVAGAPLEAVDRVRATLPFPAAGITISRDAAEALGVADRGWRWDVARGDAGEADPSATAWSAVPLRALGLDGARA